MSSTSSSPSSSGSPNQGSWKAMKEIKRREEINGKLEELKQLVQNSLSDRMSQEEVLFAAVFKLTGVQPECSSSECSPSSEGPMRRERKEIKRRAEQVRRAKQTTAYEALREHILKSQLGSEEQRSKLEKTVILDIVIDVLKNPRVTNYSTPPPTDQYQMYLHNWLMVQAQAQVLFRLNSQINWNLHIIQNSISTTQNNDAPEFRLEEIEVEEEEEIIDVVN